MKTMRRKVVVVSALMVAACALAACSLSNGKVKVRPVDMTSLTSSPYDRFYEGAVSAINDRDYALALDYLQEARARTPRSVKVLNALGVVYDKLGRFDLSARYYAQAREIEPESRIVAENLGYSQILQGFTKPEAKAVAAAQPTTSLAVPSQSASAEPATQPPVAAPTQRIVKVGLNEVPVTRNLELYVPAQLEAVPVSAGVSPVKAFAKLSPARLSEPVPVKIAVSIPAEAQSSSKAAQLPSPVPASVPARPSAARAIVKQASTMLPAHTPIKITTAELVKPVSQSIAASRPPLVTMAAQTAKPRVLTIGQPLQVVNASGKADRGVSVSQRLKALGWTVKPSDLKQVRPETALLYSAPNFVAAQALQRTLPFPVHLARGNGSAMQLVLGRDYLSWKPRNVRLGALWQKGTVVAMVQKPSTRGIR